MPHRANEKRPPNWREIQNRQDKIQEDTLPNYRGDNRDAPLISDWRVSDPAFFDGLQLPTMQRAGADMRNRIITQAVVVGRNSRDQWISYSRRPEFYAQHRCPRYHPRCFSYAAIIAILDQLGDAGVINHEIATAGQLGWQSRFRATAHLLAYAEHDGFIPIYERREIIVLRDADLIPIDYPETSGTMRMRRNLMVLNEALISTPVMANGVVVRDGMRLNVEQDRRRAVRQTMHRVFSRGSWSLNGRYYGGWWQGLSERARGSLEIDGDRVIERDYSTIHPMLLYAEAGHRLAGDAYEIDGWNRELVKTAMNTMINAETEIAALRSICQEIGGWAAFHQAQVLATAITRKHPTIGDRFFTGAGLRGMRHDSDIAEQVMLELERKGIPILPVHDSFIVATQHKGALAEAMDRALYNKLSELSGNRVISTGFAENVPQNGDKQLTAPCDLVLRRPNAKKDKPESQSSAADQSSTADQPKAAANDNGRRRDAA